MAKCKHNNGSCNANAMQNGYCYKHNPDISEDEKRANARQGGLNRRVSILSPLKPIKLEGVTDIKHLLADTIARVRDGSLDVKIANCLGVLSGQFIKAVEAETIETRVEQIERIIIERKRMGDSSLITN